MEILATLRGNFKYPPIVKIDLNKDKIIDSYNIKINTNSIVKNKRGTNGIQIHKNDIYVSLWDRVLVLDKNTYESKNRI